MSADRVQQLREDRARREWHAAEGEKALNIEWAPNRNTELALAHFTAALYYLQKEGR